MGLADDVAAIRKMWIARTGKAPDDRMDAVIRDVAQNVTDTNEGRFDFIASAFLSGTSYGGWLTTPDPTFEPLVTRPTTPDPTDGPERGEETWAEINLRAKVNQIVSGYVGGWTRSVVYGALVDLFRENGRSEREASQEAQFALAGVVPQGTTKDWATSVEPSGEGKPLLVEPLPVEGIQAADAKFISMPEAYAPQLDQFAFDRPEFSFERFLNTQDFGGRSLGQLNPAAQRQIRGEFPNRLSQFALFGAGVPTAKTPENLEGAPIFGEQAFTQFLGQAVPTAEALTERLQLLRDLRARRKREDLEVADVPLEDEPSVPLTAAEEAFLGGYFFDLSMPSESTERVLRAGLQPTLVSSASPFFNEAFARGARSGFGQWLAENPTLSFLDYAQETGLF
jgi:hypothetical protein